ncbi:hypothetical protein BVRB_5g124710 [Beta vulgaris subsp. vulgaris]|uniref:Uncharacterized protein n=1 Tax=Beta vulgaris subsp. vulgaris TaxID=3555 RepID=A0A0J8BCJ6_BETVV|nr:hypothetical protein BVRB_5g124710 [Beta vulgaris subsp. vulgaris]
MKLLDDEIVEIVKVEGRISMAHATVSDCTILYYMLIEVWSNDEVNLLLDTISALIAMRYVCFMEADNGKDGYLPGGRGNMIVRDVVQKYICVLLN